MTLLDRRLALRGANIRAKIDSNERGGLSEVELSVHSAAG